MNQLPIVILGGGIAGLSLAWQLLKLEQDVHLVEQNAIGSGASQAASGYLQPRPGTGGLRDIEWDCLRCWPEFAREIEAASGMSVDYRTDGLIDLKQKSDHARARWLDREALLRMEPNLSRSLQGGTLFSHVHWLDGRKLCTALSKAIARRGGKISEHDGAIAVRSTDKGLQVVTKSGFVRASSIVICNGLGRNELAGVPADVPLCRPVRGVTVSLAMDPANPAIRHVIKHDKGILCPRSDGRLLIGSTHEEGETCLVASEAVIENLIKTAEEILPQIRRLERLEATCGLRALVGDGLLRLGQSRELPGLYYSLSHAGAGFLRAPTISRELAAFIVSNDDACPLIGKYLARGRA